MHGLSQVRVAQAVIGYCPYCASHFRMDNGHECDIHLSGENVKIVAHDPGVCKVCVNAQAAMDAGDTMASFEIPGKVRVDIGFIGEGRDGDFDPLDPNDYPHLRFDAYDLTKHKDTTECTGHLNCCRGGQDNSYCTQLPAGLPGTVLVGVCRAIAKDIVDIPHWKRCLERWSWVDEKKAREILQKEETK